jgi:hypothetical protein
MWFLVKDVPPIVFQNYEEHEKMVINKPEAFEYYSSQLEKAEGYGEIWKIVKETVKNILGKCRVGMMLFLDYLPLSLGAYHPVGTNNMVLNKSLVEIVEANVKTKLEVNAFIYTLLIHEYVHALGYLSEDEARRLVYQISRSCFGENHVTTRLAQKSPWSMLKGVPVNGLTATKGTMELVKDFEKPSQDYIV